MGVFDTLPPNLWLPPRPAIVRAASLSDVPPIHGPRRATFPMPFPAGALGYGAASTFFSTTLDTDQAGNENRSWRCVVAAASIAGRQVRARFVAHSGAALNVDNAAIGIHTSNFDTAATPVELKFSGASGFSLSAGGTITSDWTTLYITSSDALVVILDISGSSGNIRYKSTASIVTAGIKEATDSYNQASVSGFTGAGTIALSFDLVEVRN